MLAEALQGQITKRSGVPISSGLKNFFSGVVSKNGTAVTNQSALTVSAFYAALNIIANDIAKLPKNVYQKVNSASEKKSDHQLQYLMAKQPNAYMSAFMFHSVMVIDAVTKGNGFAEIVRSANGGLESIQYIDQEKTPVVIKKYQGNLYYCFDGRALESDNIFHIPGFSVNGISGIGVVKYAAMSIGTALSSQEFAEEYYRSKGLGTGIVTASKNIDNEAKTKYSNALSRALSNSNAFKVAVIDEAGSFQHIKLTPQESLFLETNKNAVSEIARWLNVPLYKLKVTENQNNSNMEHQSMSHVVDSILPWKLKFEEQYNNKCFTQSEIKAGYFVKLNTNVLLLADKKTQSEYYSKMITAGVMTPNEARAKEDLNALPGLDQSLIPVNLQTLEHLNLNAALKKKQVESIENTNSNE